MINRDLTITDIAFDESEIPATPPDTLQGMRLNQVSVPMLLGACKQVPRTGGENPGQAPQSIHQPDLEEE